MFKSFSMAFSLAILIFLLNFIFTEFSIEWFKSSYQIKYPIGTTFIQSNYKGINFWINNANLPEKITNIHNYLSYLFLGFMPFFVSFVISILSLKKTYIKDFKIFFFFFLFCISYFHTYILKSFQIQEGVIIVLPFILGFCFALLIIFTKKEKSKKETKYKK